MENRVTIGFLKKWRSPFFVDNLPGKKYAGTVLNQLLVKSPGVGPGGLANLIHISLEAWPLKKSIIIGISILAICVSGGIAAWYYADPPETAMKEMIADLIESQVSVKNAKMGWEVTSYELVNKFTVRRGGERVKCYLFTAKILGGYGDKPAPMNISNQLCAVKRGTLWYLVGL